MAILEITRVSAYIMVYHEQSTNHIREKSIVFIGAYAPGVTSTDLPGTSAAPGYTGSASISSNEH